MAHMDICHPKKGVDIYFNLCSILFPLYQKSVANDLGPSSWLAEILVCVTRKPLPGWHPPKSLQHFLFEAWSLLRKY